MNPTAITALRILRAICITTGLALLAAARFLYANRRQILDGIARVILAIEAAIRWGWDRRQQARDAALLTALTALAIAGSTWRLARDVYDAGRRLRHAVEALGRCSTELLPAQPVPALAPITATIEATRALLEAWVLSLYPATARNV